MAKINVLVYTGPGTSPGAVQHTLFTLRQLLPSHAVIPTSAATLLNEPWTASCALLVIPGGADLGYCNALNGAGNQRITQYVRRGGRYLGLCAGGYYGSARCEFEVGNGALEVVGSRELAFFPGTCRGGAWKGFKYGSELGARAVPLMPTAALERSGDVENGFAEKRTESTSDSHAFRCYYNGGGVFVDADKMARQGVECLATYTESLDVEPRQAGAAVVHCKVGDGAAILTGTHPEFAAKNLDLQTDVPGYADLIETLKRSDDARVGFFKTCLRKLGLEVSDSPQAAVKLTPLHLSATQPAMVDDLLDALEPIVEHVRDEKLILGEVDTFQIQPPSSTLDMEGLATALSASPESPRAGRLDRLMNHDRVRKRIIPHVASWPRIEETPLFNHELYYAALRDLRSKSQSADTLGSPFMYGEVVTSTNTLVDKNHKLLSLLPHGMTISASTQIAGRGRGSNVWVCPTGSLIFSTILKHPMHLMNKAPVVFIQYLIAIAIVEAVHDYGPASAYKQLPVKLKWPNDIYARDPSKPEEEAYVKIGGILVTSAYTPATSTYDLVVGVGLNTTNAAPTTCLNSVLTAFPGSSATGRQDSTESSPPPPCTPEKLLAGILVKFEDIYTSFCRTGFDLRLEQLYYSHWLHRDQIVTVESEGGITARVDGITRDWGALRVREVRKQGGHDMSLPSMEGPRVDARGGAARGWSDTGRTFELRSDGNSFDFWQGLVRVKR